MITSRGFGLGFLVVVAVLIAPWLLHRHEKLWRDPNAFIPARFMAPAPPPDRFAYLPFGVGA